MKTQSETEFMPEVLEYRLEYTPDLRCEKETDLVPVCYQCKSCILSWKAFSTRQWFTRASQNTQRRFLVGIIKRFQSQDLLNYTWNLLQATNTKDITYPLSCVSSTFKASAALDRAMDPRKLAQSFSDLWKWFLNASFWTKANYVLLLLQMCDAQLLLTAATLIRILLNEESISEKVEQDKRKKEVTVKMKSDIFPTSKSATKSTFPSIASSIFGNVYIQKPWSKYSEKNLRKALEDLRGSSNYFISLNLHSSSFFVSPQECPSKFKDFIHYLPIHLSKGILRMLDLKSLARCAVVSPHWNFLVRELKCDMMANRALRNQIALFKGSCPKAAIPNYAKIVKVAIPQITPSGHIVRIRARRSFKDYTSQLEFVHLQNAYHGQETENVVLEERNVYCSSYNVQILIDSVDSNRVVHYGGGKLLAIGSSDRKIHFLQLEKQSIVPPVLIGHAGSIKALYLHEQRGVLLSSSTDLSIRMWKIKKGVCVKIFTGHKGDISCLDMHNSKFVSGSKDKTVKLWDMATGQCINTFTHKGFVWAAKINDTHIVSACDNGIVKVWHAETYVLIKILEGHQDAVTCLSYDEWHLVTGGHDGYVLAWSMLGKHKRCLMAFRHPREVLSLAFLYLRVISGCADGKIRIFNFLSGICLRVLRANSRGDPPVFLCPLENSFLINAEGSVALFHFENIEWNYELSHDQIHKKKDQSKFNDLPPRVKPPPYAKSEWQKRAKKKNWKLYREPDNTTISYFISYSTRLSKNVPALIYEMVKAPPPRIRENAPIIELKPLEKSRLSVLAHQSLKEQQSLIMKSLSDDEFGPETPPPSSHSQSSEVEALINYVKKKRPVGPLSNEQILLTIGTMQHAYRNDQISANMAYNLKIKDAWEPVHPKKKHPKPSLVAPQSSKQKKTDPLAEVKQLRAAGGTLGMEKISSPYETKTLQLDLKKSLFGSSVKSFIPAPTITRSKSCSSMYGRKIYGKVPSPPPAEGKRIGHFTSSAESIKIPRMKIAQPDVEAPSRRRKLLYAHTPNPCRLNSGFQLLTTQQMKEYEEAKIAEYQATKTKVMANREKVCKTAWIKKIKGLPIDKFTKEGKVAAPELGENVFI